MNKDTMMRFAQQLSNAGYTPRSYSGRGMYGRYCLSFNASGGGGMIALLEVDKEIAKEAGEPRTDSMGNGNGLLLAQY